MIAKDFTKEDDALLAELGVEVEPPKATPSGGAPALKKGRSLHLHPSRAARRCAVRGGDSGAGAATRSAGEPAYPV
jgi:hypothetical protein